MSAPFAVRTLPAVFMRGGTSKAVLFDARDLPADRAGWDRLFLGALGSPDPNGRQLDGMGGGITAVSKVCVVAPSTRADADVDYTFAQVAVKEARVDYKSNCGNMSAAVGPYAVDQGMVPAPEGDACVRIFNTNTGKLIHAHFAVRDGRAVSAGTLAIPGVSGTGAPIRLDFVDPGGANTGRLLPTGLLVDTLARPDGSRIEASLVDAANACVFVRARDVGLTGYELPAEIEARPDVLATLDLLRRQGCAAMGLAQDAEDARRSPVVPYVGVVAPAAAAPTLSGDTVAADAVDLHVRIIASGRPHQALPLTIALCAAVAARMAGTVVGEMLSADAPAALRLGMPSGVLTVAADVARDAAGAVAVRSGGYYRTARRLFDGRVYLPENR